MSKEFLETLPEEMRENEIFQNVKDLPDLATQFVNAQSLLGNSIRIPSDEASDKDRVVFYDKLKERVPGLMPTPDKEKPETIAAVHKMLGMPDEITGYEIPEVEGITVTPERAETFKKAAHSVGLSVAQLKGILTPLFEADKTKGLDDKNAYDSGIAALKGKWGAMFEIRMNNTKKLANLLNAPESLQDALDNNTLPGPMVEFLHDTFLKFSNEGGELKHLDTDSDKGLIDVAEAMSRADEIRSKLMAHDAPISGTKEHTVLMQRLLHFEKLAHPDSSTDINDLRRGIQLG